MLLQPLRAIRIELERMAVQLDDSYRQLGAQSRESNESRQGRVSQEQNSPNGNAEGDTGAIDSARRGCRSHRPSASQSVNLSRVVEAAH